MSPTFRIEPIWRVILQELDVSAESLARRAGLPANLFASEPAMVDLEGWAALWDALDGELDMPDLALELLYEDGREFGWSDPMVPGLVDRHLYRVEAMPDGRTRFVQSDELRGPLAPLLGWFFVAEMIATYPQFNRALKERVESSRAVQPTRGSS